MRKALRNYTIYGLLRFFVQIRKGRGSAAPGFRSLASGGLSYVGNGGFSYSSSVSGSNGVYLNFYVTYLYPSHAFSRAYGLQLRCLSE